MEVVRQSLRHARNPAIHQTSDVLLHRDVITQALHVRHALVDQFNLADGPRPSKANVATTTEGVSPFVSALFGSWMSGAVAVPLPPTHPDAAIEYMLRDSRPDVVLCDEAHVERMRALHPHGRVIRIPPREGFRFLSTSHLLGGAVESLGRDERRWRDEDHALILYTSGTTGRCVTETKTRGVQV